jgi:uncharacterized protein YggU (UPF0235/DUF167 family)
MPEQKEQKKDTVVKKVYVKPKPKKTETEKTQRRRFRLVIKTHNYGF